MLNGFCNTSSGLRTFLIVKYILKLIFILVPILLIINIIILISKAVMGKPDDLKNITGTCIKKLISAIIIFCLPTIVTYVFSLIGENLYELNSCIDKSTKEEIQYYEEIYEPALVQVEELEQNITKEKVDNVRTKITQSNELRGEDKDDLITRIDKAEISLDEQSKILECKNKFGTYINGYCYIAETIPKKKKNNTEGEYYSTGSGTTVDYNGYEIAETAIGLNTFLNTIGSNRVAQNKDTEKYGGACLGFSYTHAYAYYIGDISITAEDGKNYKYAGRFSTYISDDKQDVLSKVYNEIKNGKPVVLQVNGNKAGTSRHFVAVVGIKKGVTAKSIKEEDLLIIDSWDAKLESMNGKGSGSRFMTSGADCHKDYSGYRIQYIK